MSVYKQSFTLLKKCALQNFRRINIPENRGIKRWVAPTLWELKRRRSKLGPEQETPRSSYLEWNYDAEIYAFGKRLGEEFNVKLLKQALIQREYANLKEFQAEEKGVELPENVNNHELIQEGNKLILEYIKEKYQKVYPEEVTNSVVQFLTSENILSHIGRHIGLKELILTNEFPVADSTISDTFKAVVAALKKSKGIEQAEKFIEDFVLTQMANKEVLEIWEPKQPFDYLVKLLGDGSEKRIEPRLCNKSAVNTILANFQVGLYSEKQLIGIGWGESVEIAKETAALDAIQRIFTEKQHKIN